MPGNELADSLAKRGAKGVSSTTPPDPAPPKPHYLTPPRSAPAESLHDQDLASAQEVPDPEEESPRPRPRRRRPALPAVTYRGTRVDFSVAFKTKPRRPPDPPSGSSDSSSSEDSDAKDSSQGPAPSAALGRRRRVKPTPRKKGDPVIRGLGRLGGWRKPPKPL